MIEDGTLAGEGLTILQTLTYFVAAPTALFVVISFFAYITAKETRAKKKRNSVSLTSIEQVIYQSLELLALAPQHLYPQKLIDEVHPDHLCQWY